MPDAIADDLGAQVAATILMVGGGTLTNHQVVVKLDEPVVPDARFWSLAASLLAHKRLGAVAKEVLTTLPKNERDAIIVASAGTPAPTKTKRKPKPKEPVFAIDDPVRVFWNDEDWVGKPGTIASVTGSYYRVADDRGVLGGILHVSQIAPSTLV
jgi:hypothetical protein